MEKLVGCIVGRGPLYLHLDKCPVPSIWTGESWREMNRREVGNLCMMSAVILLDTTVCHFFFPSPRSSSKCFVCVRGRMCVICGKKKKKGQRSSRQPLKVGSFCSGVSDALLAGSSRGEAGTKTATTAHWYHEPLSQLDTTNIITLFPIIKCPSWNPAVFVRNKSYLFQHSAVGCKSEWE